MKRYLLLLLGMALGPALQAQVASTECMVEAAAVYSHIDHKLLLSQDSPTHIRYTHQYVMRADPKQETVKGEESRTYARNFMHLDCAEYEECTDATEAFNYRKHQFMVYRTKSTLEKSGIIPGMDSGIFKHCLVRNCAFIPAPGRDTTSFKQAYLAVDEAGQKKYQVKDLEMVWEPIHGELISIKANFTDRSRTVWASWEFRSIGPAESPGSSAAAVFLNGDGLAEKYKGVELKDYR